MTPAQHRRRSVLLVSLLLLTTAAAACSLGSVTGRTGEAPSASGRLPLPAAFTTEQAGVPLFDPALLVDAGPREHATGEARQNADGYWFYAVTQGDTAAAICSRFGRSWWQLETIEGRGGFDCSSSIHVGDILIPTGYSWEQVQETHGLPPLPTDNPFTGS